MKAVAPAAKTSPADVEKQLKGFVDKFETKHQTLIRAVRKALRKRLPTAHELVEALLAAAIAQAKVSMPATGRGTLIIRSVSTKQRPRRKPRQ